MKNPIGHSFTKLLQISYLLLILVMVIPTIYSTAVSSVHTNQYDNIITNVSTANRINQIVKKDLPAELWNIVCGKNTFSNGQQYIMMKEVTKGIQDMKSLTKTEANIAKLEVADRACTTLSKNIFMLEDQMENGSTVTQNEDQLDEIRTITSLFSDIMQDYILAEIESASVTNNSIKTSSIILSILQILIICFSVAVSWYSYINVSKSINEPLKDMQLLSNEIAQGHLTARTEVPAVEELKPLAQNMNVMASQIDLLLKKNIEEQQNFQKAEMKALQAQITPHFLYNTFDAIIWLAEQGETEDVVKITKAFSEFLRISLSRGHEWITIHQELDHIKNYLTIQKIRYADILNYEITANEELLDSKIIKLVLQPIIENAIYHGIKNKRGRGHINVNVDYLDETKENIIFSVDDDGAGFTEERLVQVKEEMQRGYEDSEKLNSVYGLYNVNKKLKLYYGNKTNGLEIQSEKNKGCKISFVIPKLEMED